MKVTKARKPLPEILLPLLLAAVVAALLSACRVVGGPVTPAAPEEEPAPAEPQTVSVYFGHEDTADTDCRAVYPVPRDIAADANSRDEVVAAALNTLFAGPTEAEREQGYSSFFSKETADALRGVDVDGDTAYVNLSDIRQVIPGVSSSCGSQAFFAAVGSTLDDAVGVENVVYAIEGDPALFYEWVQLGCPPDDNLCDPAPFEDMG